MSGGIDYVWGPQRLLARRCNQEAVEITPRASHDAQTADNQPQTWHNMARGHERETDETIVRRLVETHFRLTGSFRAREILDDWPQARNAFVKITPVEYRRALDRKSTRLNSSH